MSIGNKVAIPYKRVSIARSVNGQNRGAKRPDPANMQDANEVGLAAQMARQSSMSVGPNGEPVPTGPAHLRERMSHRQETPLDRYMKRIPLSGPSTGVP